MVLRNENTLPLDFYKKGRDIKMREVFAKKEIIDIISICQKEFDKNLRNKKLMFIYENKDRTIGKEEMFFPTTSFYHLTGVQAYNKDNDLINSYKFYMLLREGGIDESKLKVKDDTTYYKLKILPQLMRIDRMASMIGFFQISVFYYKQIR